MRLLVYPLLLLVTFVVTAGSSHHLENNEGEHSHIKLVDGSKIMLDQESIISFTKTLASGKVVIINVLGMVCDFCARGIEKTFLNDELVKKLDINLDKGKVLVAYDRAKEISFDEIEKKITANGQTAIDYQVFEIGSDDIE